uniref:alpha-amylase family glycosyl hydrolase n=1 Tax=Aureicoccus marinus TaxID=754435 RepID=UPI0029374467|nr:alpha-glucosidase C-terminal domain-containing protein [Aureicoccus marinus]
MQWDDSAHGGFTTADNAWFAVNKNFDKINAAESTANKDSVYHYYRELIALRKEEMVLVYGDFKDLDTKHLEVFAYTRTLGEEKVLVLLNFSDTETTYPLPEGMNIQQKLQGNYSSEGYSGVLQPWEAIVFRVQ